MNILADASLPNLELAFPAPFTLHYYEKNEDVLTHLKGIDVLICRSTLKIPRGFFAKHDLKFVATASSGSDHIDKRYLQEKGIILFDAKGSNANAVADYVVASVALLQKKGLLREGVAGVIGAGAVGSQVTQRLNAAGFKTFSYDPPKSLTDKAYRSCTLDDLYACHLLCIHAELQNNPPFPSLNLLDDAFFSRLSPGTVIINAARGGIVNEQDLLVREDLIYCTDVYANEPLIDKRVIDFSTLCTPHIAGHSIEAKHRAITMLSEKLHKAYSLTAPNFAFSASWLPLKVQDSWQDTILLLYDPAKETALLKSAKEIEQQFLTIRRAHNRRHDFNRHDAATSNKQLQQLLGITV